MAFVFVLLLAALVLFATEVVPVDVTAIAVMVALLAAEPVTATLDDLNLLAGPLYVLRQPGVIPLVIALQETGGADLIADLFVLAAPGLPAIVVLGLIYVVTAVLTNIISNNASVVLMIPVAVEAATQLNANAVAFVLAVTFAASTAFMTPVGYQTNLLVYGPGGYRFTEYLTVGAPLQAVFAVVTTLGIAFFGGLRRPDTVPAATKPFTP